MYTFNFILLKIKCFSVGKVVLQNFSNNFREYYVFTLRVNLLPVVLPGDSDENRKWSEVVIIFRLAQASSENWSWNDSDSG